MDRTLISGPDCGFTDEFLAPGEFITAHTSGSTGKPKPIRLAKADMIVSAKATCRFFGIGPESELACPLSASYIAGKMMIVRALVSGARLRMLTPSRSLDVLASLGRIDLLPIVPAQALSLPEGLDVGNLLVGGGAPTDEQSDRLRGLGIDTWVSYGMTETCSHVALRRLDSSVYTALPGVTFSTDSRSCLVIDWPDMTFGRLVTNDVVRLLSPSRFEWLGRHDNVINSGGIKIHPEDDERLLAPHLPGILFYITSRHNAVWGQEAVLVVTSGTATDESILETCRRILPPYHVPKAVIRDSSPQFTSSGKLRRRRFE